MNMVDSMHQDLTPKEAILCFIRDACLLEDVPVTSLGCTRSTLRCWEWEEHRKRVVLCPMPDKVTHTPGKGRQDSPSGLHVVSWWLSGRWHAKFLW